MPDRTAPPLEAKAELRRRLRTLRRGLVDREGRSTSLWEHVREMPELGDAHRVMSFSTVVGEPEVAAFHRWLTERGTEVAVAEDVASADWPDVVIVPGLAFTPRGQRLGQGGGWYDRFLAGVRDDCVTIGVCFHEQLVAEVPTEPHDVAVDVVVTDEGRCR